MAIGTGYNVAQAKQLGADIQENYKAYGQKISSEYQTLVSVLKKEWIGYDEQDFEAKLAQRICQLYGEAYELTKGSVLDIETLVNNWIKFQNSNRLSGEGSASADVMQEIHIEFTVSRNDNIVQFTPITFSESDDLGLTSGSSYGNIKDAATAFKTNLKNLSNELFEGIDPGNAFFGGQSKQIKKYIEKVGDALSGITLSIKDLYDNLDDLTKDSYKSQDDAQEDIAKEGAKSVKNASEGMSNRWT